MTQTHEPMNPSTPLGIEYLEKDKLRELLDTYGKLTLTIDGLWIQGVEKRYGTDACLQIYTEVMEQYGRIQAHRITRALGIAEGEGDIPAMIAAHNAIPWGRAVKVNYHQTSDKELVLSILNCHPQESRKARGQEIFPCKQMEHAELAAFFGQINPRAKVECLFSPPDERPREVPENVSCQWKITVE